MARFHNPLDEVRVASPCPAAWDQMIGTEQVRFCAQCRLNVYNLSGMTRAQAEHLIAATEGRLCVRFYRRADGSVLTKDCPVGWERIRRRWSSIRRAVASAVIGFFAGLGVYEGAARVSLISRRPVMGRPMRAVMGDIAMRPDDGPIINTLTETEGEPLIVGRLEMGQRIVVSPGFELKHARPRR